MKILVLSAIFAATGAMASGTIHQPTDFVLADLEPLPSAEYVNLPGNGAPVSPNATLQVTYWVQPCAGQQFDQFVVTRSGTVGHREMRVGVLISDKGIKCKGPTVQETKTLKFSGPFNLPGEQPNIKPLGFLDN